MSPKAIRRTGVPALLVSLAIAGTTVASTGTASAGAWFDTNTYFAAKADCDWYAKQLAPDDGWTNWDCRLTDRTDWTPWDLWAFEG